MRGCASSADRVAMYLLLMIEMFSPVIVIISLFKIVASIGLMDRYAALIILDALFTVAFNTWMMNGYFKTIPKDIEEAALIDGCTRVQTMTRIMLPIAVPGLVTVMIYAFIFSWNEFLFALSFISSKDKMPLTIALYNFVGRWTTQWQYLTMAAFLAIIPVLVLFYLIEKRLVAGLPGGAVKGSGAPRRRATSGGCGCPTTGIPRSAAGPRPGATARRCRCGRTCWG